MKEARQVPKVRDNPHTEEKALEKLRAIYPAHTFRKKDENIYELLKDNKVEGTFLIQRAGSVVTIVKQ